MRKPKPPPSVAPDRPTLPSVPVVAARSCSASAVTASNWLSPAPTVAMREAVSMWAVLQLADVDHDAVVHVRPALEAVAAAAYPQRDVVLPRPGEGVDHVLGLLGEDDDQRIVDEELVPAEARLRVPGVARTDDAAGQLRRRELRVGGPRRDRRSASAELPAIMLGIATAPAPTAVALSRSRRERSRMVRILSIGDAPER